MKKLCVCMLINDDDDFNSVKKCFDSISPYISAYIINISENNSFLQKLCDYFLSKNIKGKFYHDKLVNFGVNKTIILENSRLYLKSLNVVLSDWYLLFTNVNYTYTILNIDWLNELEDSSYNFKHNGNIDYIECICFRADENWEYVGATYEFPFLEGEDNSKFICNNVLINNCAKNNTDKIDADIKLLTKELKNPLCNHRSRYTFYLAYSYENINDYSKALKYYSERAILGGFAEEVYYAKYKIGVCKSKLAVNKIDQHDALKSLLDAYYFRPSRLEAIYEAAEYCFSIDMIQYSIPLLKICLSTNYPQDILFIHRNIYKWKSLYLYTRATIYLNLKESILYMSLCEKNTDMPDEFKLYLTKLSS